MQVAVLRFTQDYNAGLSGENQVIKTATAIVVVSPQGAYTAKFPGRGATKDDLEAFARQAVGGGELTDGIKKAGESVVELPDGVKLSDLHEPYPVGDAAYTALRNAGVFG